MVQISMRELALWVVALGNAVTSATLWMKVKLMSSSKSQPGVAKTVAAPKKKGSALNDFQLDAERLESEPSEKQQAAAEGEADQPAKPPISEVSGFPKLKTPKGPE